MLLFCVAPASAESWIQRTNGHLSIGYGKAFIAGKPGGSISLGAGFDYVLSPRFGVGADLGYDLLGGRDVKRDLLFGSVDYSAFQASLRLNWYPSSLGPIRRVSAGPALIAARGEVQTPFGGLAFDDLSVHETAPGAALDLSVLPRVMRPVRLGFELGSRLAFLSSQNWWLATARVAFHY